MKRFIMTKGLPGCGKSTWAEQQVLNAEAGKAIRVNRDLLRTMLNIDRWKGSKTEQHVVRSRDVLIMEAMRAETPLIISDDTNFHTPTCEDRFRTICQAQGYEFEVKDFTDVPVKTCIERDLKRARSVGEQVIRRMAKDYLTPVVKPLVQADSLPRAILVDIDGTLAHMGDRSPYEWHKVGVDTVNKVVRDVVRNEFMAGAIIIVMSGRDGSCRDATLEWLSSNEVPYHKLYMRAAGDARKDAIVKRELFDANVAGQWYVKYVLDDRQQVVDMWREMGLTCLQVAEGNF